METPHPQADAPAAPAAPSVVAVVVTHDPGPWFEEVVEGLAAQDYPNLSVLVIDTASREDPTARVAPALSSAYVRRLDTNPGFGAAANEVLEVVEGGAFFVFCHDDIALEPSAVRVMVEEAFRSNAGIVSPKLVSWDDRRVLLQVGQAADKTGFPAPYADRGDLDQEQHDAVRDVFIAPGSATLVRADLFRSLGGYDAGIELLGEDLDLSWRAHVAGARVVVAPGAVGRHLEALGERRPIDDRRRLQTRHRLRTMLSCYGVAHLVRVLPQAALITIVEALYALVVGRAGQSRDVLGAWSWNLRRTGEIRANRRRLAAIRQVRDSDVRRLQVRGSARFSAFVRGQIGQGDDRLSSLNAAGRELAGSLQHGPRRFSVAVVAGVVAVLVLGSRGLLTGDLPAVGELARFADSPSSLLSAWVSGWRSAGLGSEAPAPTAFGLLGLLGYVFVGAMGVLRKVLVLGLLPIGALGAWRLARPLGSQRATALALAVYAAIPVPYNALAEGRWGGLAVWAAAPWLLAALGRASGLAPFAAEDRRRRRDSQPSARQPIGRQVLALGLVLAVVGALVPFVVAVVGVVVIGMLVGSVLVVRLRGSIRLLVVSLGAVVVAAALHGPWTLDFILPGSEWAPFGGVGATAAAHSVGDLVRFETGPFGAPPLGWAFLVPAALPVIIGRGWRLDWAVRCWTVALACWGLLWAGQEGWLPVGLPAPEVLLAPAAAALALAAALGLVAFEVDLPGYRFGWRQAASLAAAVGVVFGALPVLGGSFGGRWEVPSGDLNRSLGFLDEGADDGEFRVLWIGDPAVVPLAGWELDDELVYATTDRGTPQVRDLWAGSSDGATRLLADALQVAADRGTSRLGRLLAPMGVRYLVVPLQQVPAGFGGGERRPPPAELAAALAEQLDLEQVQVNDAIIVYRNDAWVSTRAALPADADVVAATSFTQATATDFRAASPVLRDRTGFAAFQGAVDGTQVLWSAAASDRWSLEVDGRTAPRGKAFGWANAFAVDGPGEGELSFATPLARYGALVAQVALWIAAVTVLRRYRRAARGQEVTA